MRGAKATAGAMAMVTAMTLSAGVVLAQKGKPSPPPNAVGSMTLADRPGDGLTSDGDGAYEGATIYSSGTLYLDLSLPAPESRQMSITLLERVVSAGGAIDHVVPGVTPYLTDAVFRIDNIDAAPGPDGWGRSVGRIGFGQSLPNHALGFRYTTANGVPVYGTEVCVRRVVDAQGARVVPATWVVASSDACGDQGQAGLFEEGLKGKGYRFEAVYKVRFSATVICTSDTTCPQ
jgi:hypothetical protein